MVYVIQRWECATAIRPLLVAPALSVNMGSVATIATCRALAYQGALFVVNTVLAWMVRVSVLPVGAAPFATLLHHPQGSALHHAQVAYLDQHVGSSALPKHISLCVLGMVAAVKGSTALAHATAMRATVALDVPQCALVEERVCNSAVATASVIVTVQRVCATVTMADRPAKTAVLLAPTTLCALDTDRVSRGPRAVGDAFVRVATVGQVAA